MDRYTFQVGGKTFSIQFLPVVFMEDYDDEQLDQLALKAVYDVSFRLEDYALPDGKIVSGYDMMGTGDSFRVLGGVANGILMWVEEKTPDYLYWYALEPVRQRLYHKMVAHFGKKGSCWKRLAYDPFTSRPCRPGVFWIEKDQHEATL